MKEQSIFKEFYVKYQDTIKCITIIIAIFVAGFLFSWFFLQKPMNDNEFKICEQIAQNVYNQSGNNVIVEAPEGYNVNITATEITVSLKDSFYRGEVVAKLQNGELVFSRNMETGYAVGCSIVVGICFLVGFFALLFL